MQGFHHIVKDLGLHKVDRMLKVSQCVGGRGGTIINLVYFCKCILDI